MYVLVHGAAVFSLEVRSIIELVDFISRDELDCPQMQYITNTRISHTRNNITVLNTTIVFYS